MWPIRFRTLESILTPKTNDFRRMSDEELAEFKAGWAQESKFWILADSEQRRREGWSWPVRLSLIMSSIALFVALVKD